jgi:glycosyltransferase involved in cell wall biosynthesis
VRQSNRGLAGARNTGIRHAKGELIALLDSDDAWAPGKLAAHVQHFAAAPEVGVSYAATAFIDEESKPLGYYQRPKLRGITAVDVLCRNPIGNGSAPVLRRQVFQDICFRANLHGVEEDFFFDDQFRQSEDIECWIRIALTTSWRFEGLPEVLTLYRVNTGGLSASVSKQLAAWERVIAKAQRYAPEFIGQWGSLARGYQLRYLARRAVRLQDGALARQLIHQAPSAPI